MKQIVGGTLGESADGLRTNFVSERSAAWYAELYRRDELKGGHVILLAPGNEAEARAALAAYPVDCNSAAESKLKTLPPGWRPGLPRHRNQLGLP